MKILIVTSDYPNDNNPIPSIFVHNQVKALQSHSVEVAVLVFDLRSIRKKRKWGFSKYIYEGISVYRYAIPCGPIPYLLELLSIVAVKRGFRKVIKEFGKPDLIHAHFALAGYCALKLKKKYRIPYILTEHASGLFKNEITYETKLIASLAYNKANYLIAVGNELKKKMEEYTDKKIDVIYNILPQNFKLKVVDKNEIFTFITVGSLIYRKRIDLVISAFNRIHANYSNTKLKIIGTGPLLSKLTEKCIELNLDKDIDFIGQVPNYEMPPIYQKCHCFVLPSMRETFGVVYAEAAACGLPLIATDCGGPSDILNKTNGLLIPIDNEKALYSAMEYMIQNKTEYKADKISKDAIDRFGEDIIANKLMIAYRGIIDENNKIE